MPSIVKCPLCKSSVSWEPSSEFRPFCSKRCQLIDLGQWANEENRLPATNNANEQGLTDLDIEDIEAMLSEHSEDFFKP